MGRRLRRFGSVSTSVFDYCKKVVSNARVGNQGDILYQSEVGDVDFEWLKEYGGIVKTHGPLGVRGTLWRLFVLVANSAVDDASYGVRSQSSAVHSADVWI